MYHGFGGQCAGFSFRVNDQSEGSYCTYEADDDAYDNGCSVFGVELKLAIVRGYNFGMKP